MFLRKCTVVFLAITILISTLAVPLIYLDFELREDYIAKVLCINRDKPITVCGGQCYLTKQLGAVTDFDNDGDQTMHRLVEIIFASPESEMIIASQVPDNYFQKQIIPQSENLKSLNLTDIFHPPQLI
ncbi:MAG: hypothetical protein RLO12_08430 [Fulvivirga sp.]